MGLLPLYSTFDLRHLADFSLKNRTDVSRTKFWRIYSPKHRIFQKEGISIGLLIINKSFASKSHLNQTGLFILHSALLQIEENILQMRDPLALNASAFVPLRDIAYRGQLYRHFFQACRCVAWPKAINRYLRVLIILPQMISSYAGSV